MFRIRTFASQLAPTLAVALAVFSCGGGGDGSGNGGSPTAPRLPQVHIVQVKENHYAPKSISIEPGDTVRWVLDGNDRTHTVTARDGAFDSGAVFTSSGAVYERIFNTGGTWDYSCQAHKDCCQMQGSVRVGRDAPPPGTGYE